MAVILDSTKKARIEWIIRQEATFIAAEQAINGVWSYLVTDKQDCAERNYMCTLMLNAASLQRKLLPLLELGKKKGYYNE